MPRKWYDSTVVRIEDASPSVRRFWLQVPEETPAYKAGQFVTMDLPIGEKRLERWRSYSIANPPNGDDALELCIVQLAGGTASKYLFEQVDIGTPIRFKGPDGAFTLPDGIDFDLVLICTGTGVAPFRAMLLDIERRQLPHQRIHLIFGCRREEDILYRADFERLLDTLPGFQYSVALSRQAADPAQFPFAVSTGYVHPVYQQQYAQADPSTRFYLCGWKHMIDEAVVNLTGPMGIDPTRVRYELYG